MIFTYDSYSLLIRILIGILSINKNKYLIKNLELIGLLLLVMRDSNERWRSMSAIKERRNF